MSAIDAAIGAKLRERREEMGLLQGDVGEAIEVSRQQIQKYESGVNALSPKRMLALAEYLGVSPMYFLSGVNADLEKEHRVIARFRSVPVRERRRVLQVIESGGAA